MIPKRKYTYEIVIVFLTETFVHSAYQAPEAILPMDPDEQKEIQIKMAEREMKKPIREEDLERILYYITTVK